MIAIPKNEVTAVVVGIMQDGGLPHIGARSPRNLAAFNGERAQEYAACLAIVDTRGTFGEAEAAVWLIDATPDIKFQLNLLAEPLGPHPTRPQRLRQPDGIFLTHAHFGHIGGIPQLGPEAMAVQQLPIYASEPMVRLLAGTRIWEPALKGLQLLPIVPSQLFALAPGIDITPIPVPHRDEWGVGTFAYKIAGARHSLLYLPDIDSWDDWPEAGDVFAEVDYALVDATFYSKEELNGRDPVAHPLVADTLNRFRDLTDKLILTHINHTNPILDEGDMAHSMVQGSGAQIAFTGQIFPL